MSMGITSGCCAKEEGDIPLKNCSVVLKVRYYIYLLAIFLIFFFPNYAQVEIVTDNGEAFEKIEVEFIDQNFNSCNKGEMLYNYPNVYFKKMSLNDLLWKATKYKFKFIKLNNEEVMDENNGVDISSISIYWGRWKIYELNSENYDEHKKEIISKNLVVEDSVLSLNGSPGTTTLFLAYIRRAILGNICAVFEGYFALLLAMIVCANKFVDEKRIKKYSSYFKWIPEKVLVYGKNLFSAILLAYAFNVFLDIFNIKLYIKPSEVLLQAITMSVIYSYIYTQTENLKATLLACLVVGVFVVLTSTHMTTFLGADEVRAITEQLKLSEDTFRHWYMQNAHTNYLIMGTLFYMIPSQLIENLSISGFELAKWLHWLCGFAVIQVCVAFAYSRVKTANKEGKNGILLCGLYLSFFCCPILISSMQYYNYDMFSCVFAILALLMCYYGYKYGNLKYQTIAVLVGSLSLQEKIIVIPLMFLVCITWIDTYANKKEHRWKSYLTGSLLVIGMQAVIFLFTEWWVVNVLRAGNVYAQDHRTFTNIVYLEMRLTGWKSYWIGFALLWILLVIGSVCIHVARDWINKAGRSYNIILSLMIIAYEIFGIAISFVNPNQLDIETYIGYLLIHICNCVNKYTTVFLIITLIFLIYNLKVQVLDNFDITILLILSVVMSLLYMIMGEYVVPRYSNIYISGFMVLFGVLMLEKIKFEKIKGGYLLIGLLVTIAEMVSSVAVGYVIYYPIWNLSIYKNGIVEESRAQGVLGSTYFDKIIDYCLEENISLEDISICTSYKARVTENIWDIPYTYITDSGSNKSSYWINEEMLNENVFYCIDNLSINDNLIEIKNGYLSIETAEPIIKVRYRGEVISQIYRGNQLRLIDSTTLQTQ